MSVMSDEDTAHAARPGFTGEFAGDPTRCGPGDRAELWQRLLFTLGALIVYRLGSYLPIPGVDLLAVSEFLRTSSSGFLGLLDLFTGGGAVGHLSIFALGILPYISAFIILELASRIVPRLGGMAAGGPTGRRRLNQYARFVTVALAVLQAVGVVFGLEGMFGVVPAPGFLFEATTVLTLVAGAIFVMWLAERITVRGLGNGALVILVCGIVSRLPFALAKLIDSVKTGDLDVRWLLGTLLITAAVVPLVVVVERATRRITIYDPRGEMGVRATDGRYTHIALKLNPAGVLAPIAASVLATPLLGVIASAGGRGTLLYRDFAVGRSGHLLLTALLIALFAVFYGLVVLDPQQTARKLRDSGGFVPGYRPGEGTARYLRATQTTLAVIGAAYLVTVCVLPELFFRQFYMPLPFGGFPIFLLAWLMVRMLEQMHPFVKP